MKTFLLALAFTLLAAALPARAQVAGTLDAYDPNVADGYVAATAVQPDGKMIIGGVFSTVGGAAHANIARLHADGSLDASFTASTNGNVAAVAVQADGKIVLGGNFSTVNGTARNRIARLNADGGLESTATFNSDTGASDWVYSVAVQADGKIVLGGNFSTVNGTPRNGIARLNVDGSLESTATFNSGTGANSVVLSVAVQADGKLVMGGSFSTVNGTPRNGIARLNADGSLESTATFNPGTGADNAVLSVAVQADGKLVMGGLFSTVNGTARNRIARLNADGSLESTATFNPGTGADNAVYSVAVQANGKLVLGGTFATVNGTARNRIARLNADGSLESTTTFNPGTGANNTSSVAVQADGKLVMGGLFSTVNGTTRNGIARLLNDPAPQTVSASDVTQVFWSRGGSAPEVSQVTFELRTHGSTVWTLLGAGTRVGITANWQLTGLSLPASGHLRARGRTTGGYFNGGSGLVETVGAFAFLPTVTLGSATAITPTTATLNGTVNPNGSATTGQFEYGTTAAYGTNVAVTLSPNDGTSAQAVSAVLTGLTAATLYHYRLTATNASGPAQTSDGTFYTTGPGSLDAAFGTGGIVTTGIGSGGDDASAVAVQSDGKIVLAGTSHNGSTNDFAVARYTASGVLDASFGTGGKVTTSLSPANDQGYGVGIQSDGKIVVSGTVYNGIARDFALVRYTATGVLDASFGTGGMVLTDFGGYEESYSMVIQPDGMIVLAGSNAAATANFALARYTTTGALDAGFGSGGKVLTDMGGLYQNVLGTTLQSDGKIVVTGNVWNGSNYDLAVVRYNPNGTLDGSFGAGGKVIMAISSSHDAGTNVAVRSDGKIVVAGYAYNGSNYDIALLRFTATGALDGSFGSGGMVTTAIGNGDDQVQGMVLQSDGKIVLAGSSHNGANTDFAVVRYHPDGTLDTSFYATGKVTTPIGPGNEGARAVALQADGHIVAAGYSFNGTNDDFALVRYLGDPQPPTVALAGVTGVTQIAATLNGTVNPNGQATTAQFEYGTTTAYGINVPVTLSPNDGTTAQVVSANLTGLALGTHYHYRLTATNIAGTVVTSDGTFSTPAPGMLDVGFGSGGKVATAIGSDEDVGTSVAVQSDGKIVVAGTSVIGGNYDIGLVRYTAAGAPDASFGTGGKVTTAIGFGTDVGEAVAMQSDGKIVVAGHSFNASNSDFAVVRYTTTGALDAGFGAGGKVTTDFGGDNDGGTSVVVQSDGKIVVAGFSFNGSNHDFAVVRYTTTGALDTSFGTGGKVTTAISGSDVGYGVAVQSDGKIVVAGNSGSNEDFALVRYTTTGALDSSFGSGGKVTTPIGSGQDMGRSVAVQSDGKIVVAGYSDNSGNVDFAVVRYTTTGALDSGFGSGGKVNTPIGSSHDNGQSVALQGDGKIVVAGNSHNGSNYDFALVRYSSTGALDSSFGSSGKVTTPIGSSNDVGRGVALQSDGRIVVAGWSHNGSNTDFALVRYEGGPPDSTTLAPTLITPTTGTMTGNPVSVSYTLPEAPLANSAHLTFTDGGATNYQFTLVPSAGTHSFTFNPANPLATPEILSAIPLPDGTYTVTLYYQDALGNPAASSVPSTNVTIDSATQAPTLAAPSTNAVTNSPVSVSFSLPETALPGSVKLTFHDGITPRVLTLTSSQESGGAHAFTFPPANPTVAAQVAAGPALPDGAYTVTLSYQDTLPNAVAASAPSANVRIDTTPPGITPPVGGFTPLTLIAPAALPNYAAQAVALDAVGVAGVGQVPAPGTATTPGTVNVTLTAMDLAGNTASISFNVQALSFTQDTDADGLNDASEFNMAALGFDWQVAQGALVGTYYANANGAGLYTPAQVQSLHVGTPLISRNPATGQFTLTIGVQKSTDLVNFSAFPMTAPQTFINASGKLEFTFGVQDNAAFFRLESQP